MKHRVPLLPAQLYLCLFSSYDLVCGSLGWTFQQRTQVVSVDTASIVKERCGHYKAMPYIVRVPKQVKAPREPSLRQSRHVDQYAYDVASRHQEEVDQGGAEVGQRLGPV